MSDSSRKAGVFAICLFAVLSWVGGLAFELGPYVTEDAASATTSVPADNAVD